jgi:hypothetical protein
MHIYIDESGIFSKPANKDNIASCVVALVIPSSLKVKLFKEFQTLTAAWPKEDGEVKGKLLNENQISQVISLLQQYDVLLEINAVDLGLHTEDEITSFREGLARRVFGWATPEHPLRIRFIQIGEAYLRTSNQLFVQAFLLVTLIPRVLHHAITYYSRRIPKELKSFHWIIDAKDKIVTQFESAWFDLIFPSVEFQSKQKPFLQIEGGDYSYLEKYLNYDDDILERLEEGSSLKKDEIAAIELKRVLGDSFKFQDSKDKIGLQLADILANAVQRAFNGKLGKNGWENIGSLMILRDEQIIPFIVLEEDDSDGNVFGKPRKIQSPFAPMIEIVTKNAKTMWLDTEQEEYLIRRARRRQSIGYK